MNTIKALENVMSVLGLIQIVLGAAILMNYFDAAALINVPSTFNHPCAFILISTGVMIVAAPFSKKFRK